MKKLYIIYLLTLLSTITFSQVPESFKYQAVIRNNTGVILSEQTISVRISLVKGSEIGDIVYRETHSVTTNHFGLINLNIGQGNSTDDFSSIDWGNDNYFTQIELDLDGGANYSLLGASQLLSVPYALYAKNVENLNDSDADSTNEIQFISISNDTVYLENGGFVKLPEDKINDSDADSTNEIQFISISNDTVYLENGGFVKLPEDKINDADADTTNEIQLLSLVSDTLYLSKTDSNYIKLPEDKIDDADNNIENEIQNFSVSTTGDTLFLSKGNYVIIPGVSAANPFLQHSGTFIDSRDTQEYKWVRIGTQVWMAENLKATLYNDGIEIPNISSASAWAGLSSPGYCWYDNDEITYKEIYGALYNKYVVETDKLCPIGWHVPENEEWNILEDYLIANGYEFDGNIDGKKIGKSLASTNGWESSDIIGDTGNNQLSNNSSGFNALPGGQRGHLGEFEYKDSEGNWWCSNITENKFGNQLRYLRYDRNSLLNNSTLKQLGFSVRCVKD